MLPKAVLLQKRAFSRLTFCPFLKPPLALVTISYPSEAPDLAVAMEKAGRFAH